MGLAPSYKIHITVTSVPDGGAVAFTRIHVAGEDGSVRAHRVHRKFGRRQGRPLGMSLKGGGLCRVQEWSDSPVAVGTGGCPRNGNCGPVHTKLPGQSSHMNSRQGASCSRNHFKHCLERGVALAKSSWRAPGAPARHVAKEGRGLRRVQEWSDSPVAVGTGGCPRNGGCGPARTKVPGQSSHRNSLAM